MSPVKRVKSRKGPNHRKTNLFAFPGIEQVNYNCVRGLRWSKMFLLLLECFAMRMQEKCDYFLHPSLAHNSWGLLIDRQTGVGERESPHYRGDGVVAVMCEPHNGESRL